MATITNPTKVITGINTRWSYANVWDPKAIDGGKPKYSVSLIIPKDDTATVNKIKAAIQAAYARIPPLLPVSLMRTDSLSSSVPKSTQVYTAEPPLTSTHSM